MRTSNPTFEALHEYSIDIPRRRVYLLGPMEASYVDPKEDDDGKEKGETDVVLRNLLWLDAHGVGPVELWIHSNGGDMDQAWALYDVIQTMRNDVITVALNKVDSAATLILVGGTGTRYAMPHASFMHHGGTGVADGGPRTVQQKAEWMALEERRWCEVLAKHTSPPRQRGLKKKTAFWERATHDVELRLTAQEMIEHGIVDEIWTKER